MKNKKGKSRMLKITYRPRSRRRPRHRVVGDGNRTGKRGSRVRPGLVARPVGPLPGYALHRAASQRRVPDRISAGRQRLPSRILARAVWPLPQHAVSRPPARRKLEVTSGAYERRDCKGRLRAVFVYSVKVERKSAYVRPSSGMFSTVPHALQCTASLSWRCRPQVGQANRTL